MRLTYDVDVEDIVAYGYAHRSAKRRRPLNVIGVAALVLFIGYIMALAGTSPFMALLIPVAFLLLGYVIEDRQAQRVARKRYASGTGGVVGRQSMGLRDESLYVEAEAGGSELRLALIDKVERLPGFLVVYMAPQVANLVPRRSVVEGDFDEFADAVEEAVRSASMPPAG